MMMFSILTKALSMQLQAVIFDLDDTLYPERSYVLSGFRAVAEAIEKWLDIPQEESYAELQELYEAGVRGDTFNRWLHQHDLPIDRWLPRLVEEYRNHEPALDPYPGIVELLIELHLYCKLGVISDGYLRVQQRKFAAL